jgi:pimeloyl-ACP methyl ester carboxylesterase
MISMPTFVLVHGAWHGGWCYSRVARILRTKGYEVFTPTLTGLGERSHLASATVNASTHVRDILNVIDFEGLDDIVLVGHSYGGMIITAVADALPEKSGHLSTWMRLSAKTTNPCSTWIRPLLPLLI